MDDNFERAVKFIVSASLVIVLVIIAWLVVLGPLLFARSTGCLSLSVYAVYALLIAVSVARARKQKGGRHEDC